MKRELSILSHQQLNSTSTNRQDVVAIYAANNTWYNVTANIDETIGMLDIYKCLCIPHLRGWGSVMQCH